VLSAIARKARAGELRRPDAGRAVAEFLAHLDAGVFTRLSVERRHYRLAKDWLARGAVALPALDTLHLAVAASARLPVVTADRGMARAAGALGIEVVGLD
jgi:predicted nucleic acid-binding protein